MKSKFIAIEGIDGSGKETQTKMLSDFLKKQGVNNKTFTYPDYKGIIGQIIHQYLYKKYNFSVDIQALFYFADFVKDNEKIEKYLKEGKTIISDRYFTSLLAHQCLRGLELNKALKLAQLFNLKKPDLIIFLDVSSKVSIERKSEEKNNKLDRNESNRKFLNDLSDFYNKLAKKNVFGKWVKVDGERSREEVFEDVKKVIKENL